MPFALPGAKGYARPAAFRDRVRADVARLAGDEWQGRRARRPGADSAADGIAGEFRRIGLPPRGEGGAHFRTFFFIDGVVLGTGSRLALGGHLFKPGRKSGPWPSLDEGRGVTFSGVTPGSPAETGEIRTGDVLVRFGPGEVRNIYHDPHALGAHKPGDAVTAPVKRDGVEVSLDLVIAARPSAARWA